MKGTVEDSADHYVRYLSLISIYKQGGGVEAKSALIRMNVKLMETKINIIN